MLTMMPVEEERPMTDSIVVRDGLGRKRHFSGRLIVDLSWGADQRRPARWTDMVLYQKDDGLYALQVVGRSVVYHRANSCGRGVKVSAGALFDKQRKRYDELEPCPDCKPTPLHAIGDDDIDATVIQVEEDRPTLHECATAVELVNVLRNKEDRTLSGLAQRLLKNAARLDEEIEAAVEAALNTSEPL